MRTGVRVGHWPHVALSLILGIAVVLFPLRPLTTGHAPQTDLQRHSAAQRVQRVRILSQFTLLSQLKPTPGLTRGGSRSAALRPEPSASPPLPLDSASLPCRERPSTTRTVPRLRC
jgi:hypothetical protein